MNLLKDIGTCEKGLKMKNAVEVFPCNIPSNKKILYLEDGEYLCFACKGSGCKRLYLSFRTNYIRYELCYYCIGTGKIDFATNLIKKSPYENQLFYFQDTFNKSFKCSSCKNKKRNCKRLLKWCRDFTKKRRNNF